MTNVTNTCKQPLGLPSGIVVPPGATVAVPSWEADAQNKVVKSWLRARVLVVGGATPPAPEPDPVEDASETTTQQPEDERDEKDILIAELAEYGITKNRRSSVETLRAALAEAQAGE